MGCSSSQSPDTRWPVAAVAPLRAGVIAVVRMAVAAAGVALDGVAVLDEAAIVPVDSALAAGGAVGTSVALPELLVAVANTGGLVAIPDCPQPANSNAPINAIPQRCRHSTLISDLLAPDSSDLQRT